MKSPLAFEQRVQQRIRQLDAASLRRRLQPPSGIDLSSNDYLGLSTHPLLKETMSAAILSDGCGAGASRLLRGERDIFANVERRFAAFKKTDASLFLGSGYAANISVLSTFPERGDLIFTDAQNHASIVDGIRLSHAKRIKFPHCDVDRLAHLLRKSAGTQKFLVTESLFSMDGDFAPLSEYAELCRETNTVLIVDEAHAVGVYGTRGTGLVEQSGTEEATFLTINTAGEALGVSGAFVAGPAWAIDYLIQRARPFIFSTAPPPAVAAALDAALALIETDSSSRDRLRHLANLLRNLLNQAGIDTGRSTSQIIPVIIGDNERTCRISAELQQHGFDVRAIRSPAVPPGTARLRISVNAQLDELTLERFASTTTSIFARHGLCTAVCS